MDPSTSGSDDIGYAIQNVEAKNLPPQTHTTTSEPSTSYECGSESSGSVHFNIEDSKVGTINAGPKIYKQCTINKYFPTVAKATTSEQREVIKNCCTILDFNGNKQCEILKAKLQAFYSKLKLPKTAWLNQGLSELSLEKHFVQLHLHESEKCIRIDEIFHSIKGKKPLRILIEGQPGFGKTTLATKLAFDWATKKEYINFKLIFFIPLRELKQRTIKDAIMNIGKRCDYQGNVNIMQILTRHKGKILFVLDGVDELSLEDRYETMQVLYNQMYSDSTVLALCRTSLFKLTESEHAKLFGQTNHSYEFCDKRISILGIQSNDSKRKFLRNFISEENVNDIFERMSSRLELFNSPLILMMLPIIMKNENNIGYFSSKTDLYRALFNSILRHTCVKHGMDIDKDFDLFNFNSPPNRIRKQIKEFGKLCIQKILENDLNFDMNDLTTEIYHLGLLINHKEVTFFTSRNYYEAFHLSFMEFAAAFALSIHLKSNESALIKGSLESIVDRSLETGSTIQIMPYLANLMDDKLDLLLVQIESFSGWFSLYFDFTVRQFAECSLTNLSKSKYLRNFIYSHIYLHRQFSIYKRNLSSYSNLLKYGCECGKIKQLKISEPVPPELFSDNFTTSLEIIIELTSHLQLKIYSTMLSNLQQFLSYPIPFFGTLNERIRFSASQNIESCALNIMLPKMVESIMTEKTFKKIKYHCLDIYIFSELEKQFVLNLLENDQVQYLKAINPDKCQMDMNDLLSAVARSTNLTSLHLNNTTVDLYDITNGGTKKYDLINLDNCTITCRQSLTERNCCNYLRLSCPKNIEAVTQVEPSKFACSMKDINHLIWNHPVWVGFNSVKHLIVSVANDDYSERFLSAWTNLQTLHLQLENSSKDEELIAKSIHESFIVKLVVENPLETPLKLFTYINRLWGSRSKSHLKTIEFVYCNPWGGVRKYNGVKAALELIEGLKCSHWDEVHLVLNVVGICDIRKYLSDFAVDHINYDYNDISLGIPKNMYLNSDFTYVKALSISRSK